VDSSGALSHFSNYADAESNCVSLYTYGDSVRCAVNKDENSFTDTQGTSHGTALVAGIAALFLQEAGTAVQPAVLYELLLDRTETSDSGLPQARLPESAIPGPLVATATANLSSGASPGPVVQSTATATATEAGDQFESESAARHPVIKVVFALAVACAAMI